MKKELEPKFFQTPGSLRDWFEKNHLDFDEVWIGYFKKATGRKSISWDESVEVAICFGWIDGIRKSIDNQSYKIRFTPRNPNSIWSLKNIATAKEMIRKGLMMTPGREAFERRKTDRSGVYSFEQENSAFTEVYEKKFRKNNKAWRYFTAEAPHYRKTVIHWVMSAKQEKTRISRLDTLIQDSENGIRIKPMRRNTK